jgi:RNA polymerase sigma factor (sigma-70 family)
MADTRLDPVLRHIQTLVPPPAGGEGGEDVRLLERYVAGGDADAFAVLVRRHGPLVWRVCRRVLGASDLSEDAFQAAFLVLARRAGSIRKPASLASWLHGVAFRIARQARERLRREQAGPPCAGPAPAADPAHEAAWRELGRVLEEEVAALPERLRAPVLLCYWEGLTNDEAARRLGWPAGTVKTRLARARELLHARLTARGVCLPAGAAALLLAPSGAAEAAVPPRLAAAVVRAATPPASAAPTVSEQVAALARGAAAGAACGKLRYVALVAFVVVSAALGAGVLKHPAPAETPPKQAGPKPDGEKREGAGPEAARVDRFGDTLPPGALARLGTASLRTTASALAFAADGKTLLTAAGGRTLGRWDPDTGRLLGETYLPGPATDRCRFAPGGRFLLLPEEGGLGLWDTATGERKRLLPLNDRSAMTHFTFAPDGRTLATAEYLSGGDGTGKGILRLWPVEGGDARLVAELPSYANSLAIGPGRRLYAAVDNHSVRCWETASGKQLWQNDHWASNLAVSPDGATVAADSYLGGPLHLFDADTGKELAVLGDEKLWTSEVVFSPDGKSVAQVGGKETLVWDTKGRRLRYRLAGTGPHVAFAPDGRSLFTLGGLLLRWDADSGKLLYPDVRADGHIGAVSTVAFAPDGRSLASCGGDGTVRLWSLADGRHRKLRADAPPNGMRLVDARLEMHSFTASPLGFTPDGRLLLTDVSSDTDIGGGTLALTDTATGKEVRRFRLPAPKDGWVTTADARLRTDGKVLLALGLTGRQPNGGNLELADRDEPVRGWDVATGREMLSRMIPVGTWSGSSLSPDGRLVAVPFARALRDLKTAGELRLTTEGKALRGPAVFSPDGRLLAVVGSDEQFAPGKTLRVYETLTGRELAVAAAPLGLGVAVDFSPDGRLLAAAGTDALHVWESSTGRRLLHLPARGRLTHWTPAGFATCLAFAPDGRSAATGHADGTILVWDLAPAREALATPSGPADASACWDDLAADDAVRAHAAVARLSADPERALPWLRRHLKRVEVDPRWLAARVADLDSTEFETREAASRELRRIVGPAESLLRREQGRATSPEVRRRLAEVLALLETAPAGPPSTDEARSLRAVLVLERVASAEARALLRELAAGAADARLTREAAEALGRLERRPGTVP